MNTKQASIDEQAVATMARSAEKDPFLPPRWVIHTAWRVHRALYRLTGGRFGLRQPRSDRYGLMRITTIGRRSGEKRSVMLAYLDDGDNITTLAMNGWGQPEPAWWLNLQAEPDVELDMPDGRQLVTGREAVGEERDRLWARWQEVDRDLDAYAAKRDSETAVVVFERRAA